MFFSREILDVCRAEFSNNVNNYAKKSYIEGKNNISKINSCRICKCCEQGSVIRNIGYKNLFVPSKLVSLKESILAAQFASSWLEN